MKRAQTIGLRVAITVVLSFTAMYYREYYNTREKQALILRQWADQGNNLRMLGVMYAAFISDSGRPVLLDLNELRSWAALQPRFADAARASQYWQFIEPGSTLPQPWLLGPPGFKWPISAPVSRRKINEVVRLVLTISKDNHVSWEYVPEAVYESTLKKASEIHKEVSAEMKYKCFPAMDRIRQTKPLHPALDDSLVYAPTTAM